MLPESLVTSWTGPGQTTNGDAQSQFGLTQSLLSFEANAKLGADQTERTWGITPTLDEDVSSFESWVFETPVLAVPAPMLVPSKAESLPVKWSTALQTKQ